MSGLARPVSPARMFWTDFAESRLALLGLALVVVIVLAAVTAPWIAPQNPYDQAGLSLLDARLPPGTEGSGGYVHLLGTDAAGRDVLSAILFGLRTSIFVAVAAGAVALCLGTVAGLFAAWRGGLAEQAVMRLVDLQLSLPAILLALVLVAALGQGTQQVVIALVAAQYAYFARTAHGAASAERHRDYMDAARVLALPPARQMLRHLLPNVLPPLIVVATVQVANAIAIEATLSFLGVGMPVTEPSLGTLIANGFQFMLSGRYWISVYPGLALLALIIGINLVGDQLRDVLNPRLRK
ncbi:peptide ABC transporter permease [Pseudoroseomonas deserti]|uniref:Peptide ABC transporter permease n=1 Tax=Teichococcus deserti TaxID=1817963 RepID=A0A1V2H5G5_9PROT|nr:ABC transporter permease [Pseudoroseomonas deserti]ONG56477.1 peptide ABC transporter permease [Pseudoroseomonas deserti]